METLKKDNEDKLDFIGVKKWKNVDANQIVIVNINYKEVVIKQNI